MSLESLFLATNDQDMGSSNMNSQDLDLLFSSQSFQHDTGLQQQGFSFDNSQAPTEGSLPGAFNPNPTWDLSSLDHPTADTSIDFSREILMYHVKTLDTQVQSLNTRVESLEARIQTVEEYVGNTIEDFNKWSQKIEKHCQKTDKKVLEVTKTVRAADKDSEAAGKLANQA
ncbi:hypothetical protein NPX13_g11441 [Xylaria arbuscula]|uniref:Uncharacterized protein n=1 Tax=Xylaria arbuscula TaxID=114810 RepID=A0A9W8N2Q1_9PEZI|nr:hypothetical protein NPX13_g11441 [Xylaria arbuscula]